MNIIQANGFPYAKKWNLPRQKHFIIPPNQSINIIFNVSSYIWVDVAVLEYN
jgi:hypothetical protein